MKQSAVEWLETQIIKFHNWKRNPVFDENCFDEIELAKAIQQAKEMEKEQKEYSDELFKHMVYHMVGGLAHANNMTFNGAILDELFNKFKKEIKL